MPPAAWAALAAALLIAPPAAVRIARFLRRRRAGFDRPNYPWPFVSVIVPVHDEEKALGACLDDLKAQPYPGRVEIIAALNGCRDGSRSVAEAAGVRVVEDAGKGISFGRNLGIRAARGEWLVFCDADTRLTPGGLRRLVEHLHGRERAVAVVPGRPERGGGVVRACFWLANLYARRNRYAPPGPVLVLDRATTEAVGGFDEALPQGTSTDMVVRAHEAGADFVWATGVWAITSIRRFERTGIVRQMLSWRRNHLDLRDGRRELVTVREYADYR